jgi:uncharacterized protein YfaS (alpha-2-macroglobulin family)
LSKTGVPTDQDQILRFQTRKAFSAEFHCERENPRANCIPVKPLSLHFTAAISREQAQKIVLKGPDGKVWKPSLEESQETNFVDRVSFKGPFSENTNFKIELPPGLRDDSGRPLINADKFPLSVRTDKYPPLAKFSSRFGILELKGDPMLPVTLRNLEPEVKGKLMKLEKEGEAPGKVTGKILNIPPEKGADVQAWLRKTAKASRESSMLTGEKGAKDFKIPKPMGGRAFEVIGIPLKDPGLYLVELESTILGASLLGKPRPMFVPTAVLVTNLSVHFKWGRESSLVWVTALDTGEPVKEAIVTVRDCQEKVLWKGKTDVHGIARIEERLPTQEELPQVDDKIDPHDYSQMRALHSLGGGLLVMAQTSEDMAFVHSSWDEGIEPWRFQLPSETYSGPFITHTIFDRTLLRAGETVHMKHIFRKHTMRGFEVASKGQLPDVISIEHFGSEQKYEFPLKWDGNGIAETTWSIPKEAKLGSYEVILFSKTETAQEKTTRQRESPSWLSGGFRVEEFRIPLLRGIIQAPTEPLIHPEEIPLDLGVQYLAGGGAGLLPVRLRSEIVPKSIRPFEGFDQFVFGNGSIKEGVVRRGAALESEGEEEEAIIDERKGIKLPIMDLVLDRSGTARTKITRLPRVETPKEILTELEFKDPSGEIQTIASRIPLWHSRYLIGIKPDSWALSKEAFKFHIAVIDLSGKPVAGAPVKVDVFERKTFTHRKRLVGGFYAYEHSTETKRVANLCEGKTDSRGLLIWRLYYF